METKKVDTKIVSPILEPSKSRKKTASSHLSERRNFPESNNVSGNIQEMLSVEGACCLPNQINDEEDEKIIDVTVQVRVDKNDPTKTLRTGSKSGTIKSYGDHSTRIEALEYGENKTDNIDKSDKISVIEETISTLQIGTKTLATRVGGIIGVGKNLFWVLIFFVSTAVSISSRTA